MFRLFATLWMSLTLCVVTPMEVRADQSSFEQEEIQIPSNPSTPPDLTRQTPRFIPHCERYFIFQGTREECDSNLGKDGERLRLLMQDVPRAIAELDAYQANLNRLKLAAYIGTASLLAIIAGILISHPPFDPVNGAVRPGGYVILTGIGVAVNTLIYGLSIVKTNEAHLGKAVDYYNAAHPDHSIELQFSTRVNF